MAAIKGVTDEQIYAAWLATGSNTGVTDALHLSRSPNLRKRIARVVQERHAPTAFTPQAQPSPLRTPDELIRLAGEQRARLQASLRAKHQAVIPIHSKKPFGICVIPDQHMDAPGSNLQLIFDHAKMIRETDGLYAIEVGDSIDNFIIAKLAHARMEHIITVREAWSLVEEYHKILAPKLIAAISGNHLDWTTKLGGVDHLEAVLAQAGVKALYDADEMYFHVKAENGRQWHYGLRHHFRGGSQYHPVHSIVRYIHSAAYRGEDVVVAGHLHVAGHTEVQHSVQRKMVHAVQVGSYKDRDLDPFCRERGFMAQHPWILPTLIHFPDDGSTEFQSRPERAVPYLKYLRGKK